MASTYTPLGIELQATGENAGTWGTKTNTNLQIIEQISGGYTTQAVTSGGTVNLSVSDGATGATLSHRMIEFTGSLSDNAVVTIPLDVQTFYFLRNSTSGSYSVQFKYATGSGDSFTFAAGDKGDKIVFATANDGTNPDIDTLAIGTGISAVVDDTTPQLGGNLDVNGNDIVSTSNADIDIIPNGTGDVVLSADTVKVGDAGAAAVLTSNGAGTLTVTTGGATDLVLSTNSGTDSGTITITDGANGNINFEDSTSSSKGRAVFGNQSDLSIYHDSTNSYIAEGGVGSLYLLSNTLNIQTFTDTVPTPRETMATFVRDGAVSLYYDNSKKFETTSTGISVTGDAQIDSALLSNQENTDVDTGTETVASVAIATYTAAFFDFVIKKTTNVRSGTVYACHDGTNVEFTETSTNDLGDTSDVTLSVDISGTDMRLRATTTSDDWSVKSLIRAI